MRFGLLPLGPALDPAIDHLSLRVLVLLCHHVSDLELAIEPTPARLACALEASSEDVETALQSLHAAGYVVRRGGTDATTGAPREGYRVPAPLYDIDDPLREAMALLGEPLPPRAPEWEG